MDPFRSRRELERRRRTHGGRDWPASFADRLTSPLPGPRQVLRMMRERGPVDLSAAARIPVSRPRLTDDSVTWVGHATYVIRVGGRTILTDPVWSDRIPGVRPRVTKPGVPWGDLPPIDAVLISHNHYDHLDAPTIRRLPKRTRFYVPANLGWWFRKRGFLDVVELDWWESHDGFTFVPAHHWSRRGLTDACKSLWGGWIIGDSLYFAGDTGYGHWFAEIAARHPGIDLALMPVGAYEPNWFMKPVHLNPQEAVRATADLGARRMATMHWGTFVLSGEPLLDPLEGARAAWAAAGRPREDLWDLAVGETRRLTT